jgi:hypothetical protein
MDTTKRRGKCINFGNCAKADRQEIIELDFTEDFLCPECEKDLMEQASTSGRTGTKRLLIAGLVATVLLLAGGAYFLLQGGKLAVKKLTLSESQLNLTVGDTHTLTYTAQPTDASTKDLVWSSSKASVATVTDGVVTAIADGKVQISLSTPDGKVSSRCSIDVNAEETINPPSETGGEDDITAILNAEGQTTDNGNGTGVIRTSFGKYEGDLKDGKANGNGVFQVFKACRISARDQSTRRAESGDYLIGQFENNQILQVKWLDRDKNQKDVIIVGR